MLWVIALHLFYCRCLGDEQENIHLSGYQVSNQGMALVRDSCLVPTIDVPELGYIRDSSQQQYVPDVFYKASRWQGGQAWHSAIWVAPSPPHR